MTSNKDLVDRLIADEPADFYAELYKILAKDCKTLNLHSFKNFYIVRRLPLYNVRLEHEALKIVDAEMKKQNGNMGRIFKTLLEDVVGHGTIENFCSSTYLFHYVHDRLGKVITAPHVITNMSHIITAMNHGIDVKDYDIILEFGGGYGGMAKVCSGMGYNETYYIYDLPELRDIQEYHLTHINVKHEIINEKNDLQKLKEGGKKLFIATWSISEVDDNLRNFILDVISGFDSVFIIFQHNNPVGTKQNNYDYFCETGPFQQKFTKILSWHLKKMNFVHWDGGSYYLIGNSK